MKHFTIALAFALSCSVVCAQNLINNGLFETGPYNVPGTVTDWTLTGHIEITAQGATSPSHSAAFGAGGESGGNIMSQNFATIPNQIYTLDFEAAIFGVPSGTLQLQVEVEGNSPLISPAIIAPPVANTFDPNLVLFQHYHYTFTADSASTTLRFTDMGSGNSAADPIVDTVVVTPKPSPTPTPTQNLLLNGDFETGPFSMVGTVNNWIVSGNVADTVEGATSGTHSAALSAGTNSQSDMLSQSFATTNGKIYSLDFDAGTFGIPTATAQLKVEVIGSSTLLDQTITPTFSNGYDPSQVPFQHYHFAFTANGANATVRFTSIGVGNSSADQVVDSVVVLPQLQLTQAVSRKNHGGTDFDFNLPLTGEPGVECRRGTPTGSHTLVFTFANNVVSGNASPTGGSIGGVGSPTFAGNTMTVVLTGVADAQQIEITLSGVTDTFGQVLPDTPVGMNVLLGDVTVNKSVDSADISQTKARSGSSLTSVNIARADVDTNGSINSADIALVKTRSGNGIPESRQQSAVEKRALFRSR